MDITESFGLPLLELKAKHINQSKKSKLIDDDYETERSKSDHKIVKDITFFTNNPPSFKKYKNTDDLTFNIDGPWK